MVIADMMVVMVSVVVMPVMVLKLVTVLVTVLVIVLVIVVVDHSQGKVNERPRSVPEPRSSHAAARVSSNFLSETGALCWAGLDHTVSVWWKPQA